MISKHRYGLSLIMMGIFLIFGIDPENLIAKIGLIIAGVSLCGLGVFNTYLVIKVLGKDEK
jgi:hypothetical protein